jgi:hypothetical protein
VTYTARILRQRRTSSSALGVALVLWALSIKFALNGTQVTDKMFKLPLQFRMHSGEIFIQQNAISVERQ